MTKNILITGETSYVGNKLVEWLSNEPEKYKVTKISVRDDKWKEHDFFGYDTIVHVAGIAHIKETKRNENLYYKVNRDLTINIAKKAKKAKIKHFIFISSMSVYGISKGTISEDTPLDPQSAYGKSKKYAEEILQSLIDDSFILSILRPPMIYGKRCKGNYVNLKKIALKIPMFPNLKNERSMIYIDNLSEFIKQLINNQQGGIFFPQNQEYVNTSEMVSLIAKFNGVNLKLVKIFNPIIKILDIEIVNKVFGSLNYDLKISDSKINYRIYNFEDSIKMTESRE